MNGFHDQLNRTATTVRAHLSAELAGDRTLPVTEAMRYALLGGKGLRGFLVVESAKLHGIAEETAVWAAAAIEAMHTYSLVHDDLPSMDDDDLRRGQPTVHVKWDEATAILAGDALQALAFDMIGRTPVPAERVVALSSRLARAAGVRGMVLGQALDIGAEAAEAPLDLAQIADLQAAKTGALIAWSATAGPVMADADTGPLTDYATALGLAFQIADDLLDVSGDAETAGKRLRKDEAAGKATFVSLMGVEGARSRARDLVETAEAALATYGAAADVLKATARFVIDRDG